MKSLIRFVPAGFLLALLAACSANSEMTTPTPDLENPKLTEQELLMVKDLDAHLVPLQGASPNLPDEELKVFDFLGAAKIVGMGEATHGTSEFFQMKHRLFKYLVEKHGFKVLAFEFDFAQGITLNEMILTGKGDVNQYVRRRETMIYWPWSTQEVSDLFVWMQDYNRGKSESEKIQVIGVDCQITFVAQQLLPQKLEGYDAAFAAQVATRLDSLQNPNYQIVVFEQLQNERVKVRRNLNAIKQELEKRATAITAATSPAEYQLMLHMIEVLFQVEEYDYTSRVNYKEGSLVRDRYMAANTEWILQYLGNVKIALWAHNAHVSNDDFFDNYGPGSQGYHLKKKFGNDYQIVGFSFGKGKFYAINGLDADAKFTQITISEAQLNTLNYFFHLAKEDNFIIKMADLKTSVAWQDWLVKNRVFKQFGLYYVTQNIDTYLSRRIGPMYDVLIHFDNSTASELLFE